MQHIYLPYSTIIDAWQDSGEILWYEDRAATAGGSSRYCLYLGISPLSFTHEIVEDSDTADFEANYKALCNKPPKIKGPKGQQKVTPVKDNAVSNRTYLSPNFCDPCSWWQQSTRKTDIAADDSGDPVNHQTWDLPDSNLVSIHKRITRGNEAVAGYYDPDDYKVIVKVNGTPLAASKEWGPELPGSTAPGDGYKVDYVNGKIIFDVSQAGNTVEVDYSAAGSSTWRLTPPAGKRWHISYAEIQFDATFLFDDGLAFDLGLNCPATGDNDVVVLPGRYRSAQAIFDLANVGSRVPGFAELAGLDVIQLPFLYVEGGFTVVPVGTNPDSAHYPNEVNWLEMYLEHDVAPTGTLGSAAFVVREEDL